MTDIVERLRAERDAAKLQAAEAVVALNNRDRERMQAEREARAAEAERDELLRDVRQLQEGHNAAWEKYSVLASERFTLRAERDRLREALQWMVDNDDTNTGDEPLYDHGGLSWNEINAYWIAGLNRARAALKETGHE
jgi:uncharacterized coiled-coil DUF342 family protein